MLTMADVAEQFDVPVSRIGDYLDDHKLVDIRLDGKRRIPAALIQDRDAPNKFVAGAITVLVDGGYRDDEILLYLFTEDDSLPGRPVDALHGHKAREVIRRAQAMAL